MLSKDVAEEDERALAASSVLGEMDEDPGGETLCGGAAGVASLAEERPTSAAKVFCGWLWDLV
jgi:hypothetical protein